MQVMQLRYCNPYMATIQEICSKKKGEATLISETYKVSSVTTTERSSIEIDSGNHSSSSHTNQKTLQSKSRELDEIDEVKEENGRLKLVLSNIMNDYKTLQQHIGNISTDHKQQEKSSYLMKDDDDKDAANSSHKDEDDLVILSLGRSSRLEAKNKDQSQKVNKKDDKLNSGLALRLDRRSHGYSGDHIAARVSSNQSPRNIEDAAEAANDDHKGIKPSKSGDDENVLQKDPAKKARVSVRAICNGPTMNDGCQWRKYGQKKAKGNPCPRAYYRCTMSPSCPVRKHVQRCPENMSILITTYEGTHNHSLPPSATAMASTTSAAVSMLKSCSSTSTSQQSLNFPSTNYINHHPFYVPNTTLSTFQSHPTITLDLTTPSASSRYNKYSSTFLSPQPTTYSPSACLNFSAASSSEQWTTNHDNYISSSSLTYSGTQLHLPSRTPFYQPYNYNTPNKHTYIDQTHHQPQFSAEKIAAATQEITSNPSFQSALAAAISSIFKRSAGLAESMESPLGAEFATSSLIRTSTTAAPSISQQAGNSKFDFTAFDSSKGPFVPGSAKKGENKK